MPMALVRIFAVAAGLLIAGLFTPPSRAADTYPERKVRVIVPFAAGGPTDVIARMVAEQLSQAWGQQLYVENMPGAGGNLGVETGARAAPDGYTIVVVSTGFIINPSMYAKIGYDPVKDFAPISLVAASPNVVTVHPSVAAKDLKGTLAACAADASVLPQNSPLLTGHEAIGKLFGDMFQAPEFKIEWHPLKVEVAKSGDLGYSTGVYSDSVKDPASGKTIEDHGKYLTVWKKQKDGSWKVQYDIFNTDLPEATH